MADMRIAQLANFVGPTSGGMKVVIENLAAGYVAAGHERIFVSPGERDEIRDTDQGIHVLVKSPKVSPSYRMVAAPWRALEVLERFGPTSIEVSDKWTLSPAGRWAAKRGIGSVMFSHERLAEMMTQWLRSSFGVETVVGALNRRLAREFDKVVVTSQYAADEFDNTGADLVLVPLGVDLTTFHPSRGAPAEDGLIKLAYVGRLSREKMPQLAVEATVELHRRGVPVKLTLHGDGPDEKWLRGLAGEAPVEFAGFAADRTDVAARFAAADISMSCSPTETFGLAVLEALACGTPVITSSRGGGRELVTQECGGWADPDPAALADAVERLSTRLGPELRSAARAQAERFAWGRTVDLMLGLHSQLAVDPVGRNR
ncbi:MAG: glycosyltransferase [Arachnia sp.]